MFTKIKNGDFDIVFAPELMNFFEKNKPYQKNVPFNIKQKKMIDAWERFNNSRRNRTIRELNEKLIKDNIEQSLLRATLSKEIRWLEVLDVHSQTTINRQYVCDFYNLKWDFTVSGYKKENKWRANFELKWKNRYDDMSSFGGACHAELYKAIRDSVIRKEKPIVNQYIKKREPGERKREIEIGSSDFLVRTNLFRCYHKEHLVEEILGVVKVVSEAVTAFIAHITAQFPNAKFYAEVVSENRASIKILKKLNFVEKSIEKNGFALNGFNHDLIRFEK